MKASAFQSIKSALEHLTPHQKQQLLNELGHDQQSRATTELIESRLEHQHGCPHCQSEQLSRWGQASGLQRYRCKGCHATFNALTGTALARLRLKDKWFAYSQQLAASASIRASAKACGINSKTAFLWRHRLLKAPEHLQAAQLNGIAEADETVFLNSYKGQKHDMPRPARHRGGKASKRGMSAEHIPVLLCRDRSGATADFVLAKDDKAHIVAALKPIIASDALLCTDSGTAICAAAKELHIAHRAMNLTAGVRVLEGIYHVQNVNAYGSRLKTWMIQFHGVATKYLPRYLGWRRLFEQFGQNLTPPNLIRAALGIKFQQVAGT